MKTLLILLLGLTTIVPQQLKKEKQTLFDFRTSDVRSRPKITAATQRAVLTKVFRKYLTDGNKCKHGVDVGDGGDLLAAARNAGQIVPSITDVATGSFTAAGQTQTVYVIEVSECTASHADNFGTKRVAIFSGQQLIADFDNDFRNGIVLKTDLNSDGINELLMTTDDMSQGTLTETAALVSFQNGRLNVIKEFGTVVEDSCASGFPGSASKASVISISDVVPGQMPRVIQDNYQASCANSKRWKFLSSGQMP
ncbi:MAG TPA: hypothetical protein VLA93_02640 [Pyrinomonadaceae bacterium]|nr:hypothetical protein [Pyrinomonadaceae bacterium]